MVNWWKFFKIPDTSTAKSLGYAVHLRHILLQSIESRSHWWCCPRPSEQVCCLNSELSAPNNAWSWNSNLYHCAPCLSQLSLQVHPSYPWIPWGPELRHHWAACSFTYIFTELRQEIWEFCHELRLFHLLHQGNPGRTIYNISYGHLHFLTWKYWENNYNINMRFNFLHLHI